MPYLTDEEKEYWNADSGLQHLLKTIDTNGVRPDELNYVITKLLIAYVQKNGFRYFVMHDAAGAATDAVDEFKRVLMAKYEDFKQQLNGNVYAGILHELDVHTQNEFGKALNDHRTRAIAAAHVTPPDAPLPLPVPPEKDGSHTPKQ